jgi:hypothetical protein
VNAGRSTKIASERHGKPATCASLNANLPRSSLATNPRDSFQLHNVFMVRLGVAKFVQVVG